MSIYVSMETPSDWKHEDGCAHWLKRDGIWEISGQPCTCGQPDTPIIYQGSHILPKETDPRGGDIDIAWIPAHIRSWRDNPHAPVGSVLPPDPFLRFGVNEETVILTIRHVKQIHDELTWWLQAVGA